MFKGKKLGFTFVEVMLVMALISFLYIVTMKVIQHNLDQKVPVYVYNLYKNLDNESKLLTKKLLEDANGEGSSESGTSGSGGGASANQKSIEEVLKKMDAKSYCEAFANDANLIGNADCENSINNLETGEAENKNATYTCERTYSFNVNDDGTYKETFTPSYDANLTQCKDNENFDDNISCNAKPTEKIANLMLDNTQNYHTYSCKKDQTKDNNETTQDVVAFDIDDTKPDISKSLKTTNNIHLNFVTLKPGNNQYSITYNLAANVNQDAICPKISRAKFNTSNTITCSITFSQYNLSGNLYHKKQDMYYSRQHYSFSCGRASGFLEPTFGGIKTATFYGLNENIPEIIENCTGYIKHAQELSEFKTINFKNYQDKFIWEEKTCGSNCKNFIEGSEQYDKTYCQNRKTICENAKKYCNMDENLPANVAFLYVNTSLNQDTILDNNSQKFDHKGYYTKWDTFFNTQENGKYIFTKATKAAITPDNSLEEGSVETTLDKTSSNINDYLAHFIYASIDIPFAKGTIGKNIFVFEQFGSKIIPVGYLANNQNTPLKFNVITRNPETFKIEKVNEKPLTFCEAMKYTGDKFSQYCGCVDTDNKIVTQYPKMDYCDNKFGCIIRPVQPSSGRL